MTACSERCAAQASSCASAASESSASERRAAAPPSFPFPPSPLLLSASASQSIHVLSFPTTCDDHAEEGSRRSEGAQGGGGAPSPWPKEAAAAAGSEEARRGHLLLFRVGSRAKGATTKSNPASSTEDRAPGTSWEARSSTSTPAYLASPKSVRLERGIF